MFCWNHKYDAGRFFHKYWFFPMLKFYLMDSKQDCRISSEIAGATSYIHVMGYLDRSMESSLC